MDSLCRLDELVAAVNEKSGSIKNASLPYLGLEHIGQHGAGLVGQAESAQSISTNSIFKQRDVLFGKLRPNLRKCLLAPFDGYCSTDVLVLRPNGEVDPRFAARVFQADRVGAEAERTAAGTKMPRTSWNELRALKVFCPDLQSQERIADVIDTLDTTISQTEAIIEKLKQVKQGLLHDLLTRGIDANDELRPPQNQAPHLYKDSPLGWIPSEWSARPLGDVIGHLIDYRGRTPKKLGMEWGGGDILALSANNVQMGGIDTSREANFGSDRLYARWMTNGDPAKSDVLMTLEAPLGNIAQVPDDRRYILSQRVILMRFDADLVTNNFAFWQLISDPFQRAMVKLSTGTTASGIQRAKLVLIQFAVPPLEEQQAIDERLRAIEARLAAERSTAHKHRLERSGLMDDLLTGRVRVNPLLD